MSLHNRHSVLSSQDSEVTAYDQDAFRAAGPVTLDEFDEQKDGQHDHVSSPVFSEKNDEERQQQQRHASHEEGAAAAEGIKSEWDLDGCLRVLAVHLVYIGTW